MPSLEGLKGQTIFIRLHSQLIEQKSPVVTTKLIAIDTFGVWIEGRELANYFHETEKVWMVPKMPIFFVPFSQIALICSNADYPSLSETQIR